MIFYEAFLLILTIIPVFWNFLQVYYFLKSNNIKLNNEHYKTNDHKSFSFIIAEKNEKEEIIDGLINNLLNLDYDDYEIIIVSDDSSEMFKKKYEKYKGIQKVKAVNRINPKGKKAGALNYGVSLAKNEYLVFLDADARVDKDFLKRISEYDFEILALRLRIYNAQTQVQKYYKEFAEKVMDSLFKARYYLGLPIFPNGSALCIRKDTLIKLGGWKEDLITEDLELGIRLFIKGYKVKYANDIVVYSLAPFTLNDLYSQIERWAYGSAQLFLTSLGMLKKGIRGIEGFLYSQQWGIYGLFVFAISIFSALNFILKIPSFIYLLSILLYGLSLSLYSMAYKTKVNDIRLPVVLLNASISGYIKGLFRLPFSWRVTPKTKEKGTEEEKISFIVPVLLLFSFINLLKGQMLSSLVLLFIGIMEAVV